MFSGPMARRSVLFIQKLHDNVPMASFRRAPASKLFQFAVHGGMIADERFVPFKASFAPIFFDRQRIPPLGSDRPGNIETHVPSHEDGIL